MLVDDVIIEISAGHGGKGAVAFNKNMMSLGPAGGSGGRGGSIFFIGTSDLSKLNQFRFKKEIKAEDGRDGRGQFIDGKSGADLIVLVPVGTVLYNTETNETKEVTIIGERTLVAKGGGGGKGNFHFRSPKNTSPKIAEEGKPGEYFTARLELKMIADIGLAGLPNVGKTSLLNKITRATAKVGNYAFTTLEPNLGAYYELIIADLPGLIEGASSGKGLGIKFLRHIERTKEIFHLVSAESESPIEDYKTVRNELLKYSKDLANKKETVFISKSDSRTEEELSNIIALFKKEGIKAEPMSTITADGLIPVIHALTRASKKKEGK